MIVITDYPATKNNTGYWEVCDKNANTQTKMSYYDDAVGYDRVRVLKQIVDFYAITGYAGGWTKAGKEFTLTSEEK
jgi:hypothetical protein